MGEFYDIIGGLTTVEPVSDTETRDVESITFRAKPSGVVFTHRFLLTKFTAQAVDAIGDVIAQIFNNYATLPGVTGVSTFDDTDDAGNLVPTVLVTISADTEEGALKETLALPFALGSDDFAARVASEYAKLRKIVA